MQNVSRIGKLTLPQDFVRGELLPDAGGQAEVGGVQVGEYGQGNLGGQVGEVGKLFVVLE